MKESALTKWLYRFLVILHLVGPLMVMLFIAEGAYPPESEFNHPLISQALKVMWIPLLVVSAMTISVMQVIRTKPNEHHKALLSFVPTLAFAIVDTVVFGAHWWDSLLMFGLLHYMAMAIAHLGAFVVLPLQYSRKKKKLFAELVVSHSIVAVPSIYVLWLLGQFFWQVEYGGQPLLFILLVIGVGTEALGLMREFDKEMALAKV